MIGSPAPATRTTLRRDRMREELVLVAWQLCRRDGLAALSLREVAARFAMRAPSLYTYFESKHAIYDAMFAEGQRQLLAEVVLDDTSHPAPEGSEREALLAGAHRFVDFCTADPTRHQLLFQRTLPGFEPSADSYALAEQALRAVTDQLATLGVTDPRHADLWTATISGLVSQQLANDPGGDRWSRLTAEAVTMFCDHVGVPADPDRGSP